MSKLEVNTIAPQCGTTLTLGESGDTVTLASGASQSGFGRTGTVDWQTTIKTGDFTAVNGEGYFINTTGGTITMTLPASPSVGNIVSIKDYARQFGTNALTVDRNGSNLDGTAVNATFNVSGLSATFIYMDATKGWSLINDDETQSIGAAFISASGGNSVANSPCGNFKIHTFTGPGTFSVASIGNLAGSNELEYIVVAGGGANPGINYNNTPAGGGGAGGFRFASPTLAPATYPAKPLAAPAGLTAVAQSYPITIGAGGTGGAAGPPAGQAGTSGSSTTFSTIVSAGGGLGGYDNTAGVAGGSGGGSGGGGSGNFGAGNTPPVSPPQGNPGGLATNNPSNPAPGNGNTGVGGGGGAIAAGSNGGTNPTNPNGGGGDGGAGAGVPNAFGTSGQNCGSNYYFAGGGGGSTYTPAPNPGPGGAGGLGGGGTGRNGADNPNFGTPGTVNTGGGAGAPGGACSPTVNKAGSNGGSGIVIIRYKFQ